MKVTEREDLKADKVNDWHKLNALWNIIIIKERGNCLWKTITSLHISFTQSSIIDQINYFNLV